jgi:hypothetical protein
VRLGAAIALAVAVGLGGAFKEIAILGILVPLLMWHLTRPRGVSVRWFAAATVAVVFLIFPFVSLWRAASDRIDSADPRDVVVELPHQTLDRDWVTGGPHSLEATDALTSPLALTSHRLYGFDSMVLLVRYTPSEVPHQDGATLLNLAAGLVPRIFWADKPNIGIGYWFGESYWGTPEGVPVVAQAITHPGELYVDFGVVGVIVGMAILGLWYRLAWEALRPRASAAAALIYTIVFATVVVVDRDLPLVYITLVQRLAVVGLFLGALALIGRITPRRTA